MRLRHAVPAGMLDAGFASLATLVIGVYAARSLPAPQLGTYALFFSAFIFATVIPTQLVLAPAEFATVSAEPTQRLAVFRQMWRIGLPTAATAAAAGTAAASLAAKAPASDLWPLAVTTIVCSLVSPLQDHIRRTLHFAGVSWRAAAVSLVQLSSVILALLLLEVAGVGELWRPFGALAFANVGSASIGLLLSRRELCISTLPRYRVARLMQSGRWLLALEITLSGAAFLSSALITRLASPDALGYAEASRIVAQPLFVLAVGMGMALAPRWVEAGATRSREAARRVTLPFATLMVSAGALYGAFTIMPWGGNPLAILVPQAYAVEGLVTATVIAFIVLGISSPYRSELIGAGRERLLPRPALLAGVLQCAVAAGAAWLGAYARPLGLIVFNSIVLVAYLRYRRGIYQADTLEAEDMPGRT